MDFGTCGSRWQAPVARRTRKRSDGCPVCAGKVVRVGLNDLATVNSDMAAELAPDSAFSTQGLTAWSHRLVPWICGKGHRWETEVFIRTAQAVRSVPASKFGPE
jgi:hypothetical protein